VSAAGADRLLVLDLEALGRVIGSAAVGSNPSPDPYLGDRLDLAGRFVRAALPTGSTPVAVAVAPDGRRAYVADRLSDAVTVIDTSPGGAADRVAGAISLGGPDRLTPVRRGERLFYNSAATFAGQFTCATCHPDTAHDGLVYDISPDGLGRNLVDSKTLRGVRGTAPFKWNGHNPDLHTQCGPRAAKFINRSPGFTPSQLDDLVAYESQTRLEPNRNRSPDGRLTPLQAWGKKIFERTVDNTGQPIPEANRCSFCHSGPHYTDNRSFDVGTRSEHDDNGIFDTPGLNDLDETAPYLHDGKALTLEEIWTLYNPDDRHGRANDLSKDELNALIEYLRTL
jgi:YVTN family beta-propeller protein